MRLILCENYEEMSKQAAKLVASQITLKPDSILGLATGSTPIGLYDNLIEMNKNGEIDFSEITSFNLDEYYPIKRDNDQSYYYFMNEHLFSKVNINKENTHIPNGEAEDPEAECKAYEKQINAAGGVDLQILGIGQNGHIGFNEPADTLCVATHVTDLTPSTIKANARFFASEAEVPTRALTMGMGTILRAKKILIMANGAAKRDAVATMLAGGLTTACPASLLNLHADVTLVCDGAALGR